MSKAELLISQNSSESELPVADRNRTGKRKLEDEVMGLLYKIVAERSRGIEYPSDVDYQLNVLHQAAYDFIRAASASYGRPPAAT